MKFVNIPCISGNGDFKVNPDNVASFYNDTTSDFKKVVRSMFWFWKYEDYEVVYIPAVRITFSGGKYMHTSKTIEEVERILNESGS